MRLGELRTTNQDNFIQNLLSINIFGDCISIPLFARTETHKTNKLIGIIILVYMTGKYKRKFGLVK